MVSPGSIYFKGGLWNTIETQMPERYQATLARNPMGRMGRPEEVADAAVWLASPRASFVTGTNLVCDGAITQRVGFSVGVRKPLVSPPQSARLPDAAPANW